VFDKKNIATFSLLLKLPIIHGFSWGEEAPNMSEVYSDDRNTIEARVSSFLIALGIRPSSIIVRINPNNDPHDNTDITEITKELLKRKLIDAGEIEVSSNAIFTKLNDVVLTVKPADCAICILYFENNRKEKFVGLIHCSAKNTDKLLPKKTIEYLMENYSVEPKTIKVGITPAISKEYFYVNPGEIQENNWEDFMEKRNGLIFLNIVGNTIFQLKKTGILSESIQYYGIDTFTAALVGKTFSHRLARDLNLPNGRYIVAASLK